MNMGRTIRAQQDNDPSFLDFEGDIDVSGVYERRTPPRQEKKVDGFSLRKKKVRAAPWEDDWTDPEDDLMRGFPK